MCVALEETSLFASVTLSSSAAIEFANLLRQVLILSNFVPKSNWNAFSSLKTSAMLAMLLVSASLSGSSEAVLVTALGYILK